MVSEMDLWECVLDFRRIVDGIEVFLNKMVDLLKIYGYYLLVLDLFFMFIVYFC